jgi:hypothetical protein
MGVVVVAWLVGGCGSGPRAATPTNPPDVPADPDGASPTAEAPPPSPRCLPVVAADCGCVYACGVGEELPDGRYRVSHSFWSEPIVARVAPWCVNDACTDAFHGEIVCDGICPPKPADATCHFDGDRCVGADTP